MVWEGGGRGYSSVWCGQWMRGLGGCGLEERGVSIDVV